MLEVSHPGGVETFLVTLCYSDQDKLGLGGPLGLYTDLTFAFKVIFLF